jgi:hypothetical protein
MSAQRSHTIPINVLSDGHREVKKFALSSFLIQNSSTSLSFILSHAASLSCSRRSPLTVIKHDELNILEGIDDRPQFVKSTLIDLRK